MSGSVNLLALSEGAVLVQLARTSLGQFVQRKRVLQPDLMQLPTAVQQPGATFVTLHHQGQLRGCIGNVVEVRPLAESIVQNTVAAASRDPRFPAITRQELADVQVEVTVLTPLRPLLYANYGALLTQLRPHMDGVMLEWGERRGVLLPQMWQRISRPTDFLMTIAKKAAIPPAKLQAQPPEVEAFTFQAQHFVEDSP